jgi:methylenetetrahydrofolate reductase (NADPH)
MKFIRDIHAECRAAGRPAVSFEFFPPKTDDGVKTLFDKVVPALREIRPDYCSVTYGAGGSTRESTIGIVDRIQREHGITSMMHLTCVNATRDELKSVVDEAGERGIRNILALRGDPPNGSSEWVKTEGGFEFSRELVAFLRELGGFSIGTAGFPEGHIA